MQRALTRPSSLSAAYVRTVKEPGRYSDGGRGSYGLSLLVRRSANGGLTKSWIQRLRINGRPTHIGLGPLALVSLTQAREVAIENAKAVRAGVDPLADRKRSAAIPSFRQAAEKVISMNAEGWKDGTRTASIWRARLDAHVHPAIGNLRVDNITSADLLNVLLPIWTSRRETARKTRGYISAVTQWAISMGFRTDNPARDVVAALPKAGRTVTHQRALPWRDVHAALGTIEASGAAETTKLVVRFLALTATRSGEVRGARWPEIDLDSATWTVPASRMKSTRQHRIPLSPEAMAVLDRAREFTGDSNLVFPSPTGRVMSDATVSKLFRENGIQGTPHGLRSSFRVWAAESSIDRVIAELALSHVAGSSLEISYQRSELFDQRRAVMEQWAEALSSP